MVDILWWVAPENATIRNYCRSIILLMWLLMKMSCNHSFAPFSLLFQCMVQQNQHNCAYISVLFFLCLQLIIFIAVFYCVVLIASHFLKLDTTFRDKCARHTMAQASFLIGEKVLCYETDPGKVNKLYTAVVNQVIIEIVLKVCWICTCTNWAF